MAWATCTFNMHMYYCTCSQPQSNLIITCTAVPCQTSCVQLVTVCHYKSSASSCFAAGSSARTPRKKNRMTLSLRPLMRTRAGATAPPLIAAAGASAAAGYVHCSGEIGQTLHNIGGWKGTKTAQDRSEQICPFRVHAEGIH